ncbi:SGNH/GDSL hydrolase family protein [Pseudosporangium ferrugineum]|uniref:Lysophospholipase L1-like esterase n=1 Tax=Pseudosporangium ferrugineum TaxID=439699 RepID=A0A2T0SJS5_9ACTN|nr:SGNH/GDSL hydrolase family protein [Pseudosporangium ferrugineum]PRY33667.1 lysophospholipase L1-like esterase [Pseudosporangium ferrugineum]
MRRITRIAAVSTLLLAMVAAPAEAERRGPAWTTAWATAPAAAVSGVEQGYAGFTIRNVVHTTTGGSTVRIHLSNRFGTQPVLMGHVTVAISAHTGGRRDGTVDRSDGSARPGTVRDVLFAGRASITVPARAEVVSDPVRLSVPADQDLLVSTWTPQPSGTVTYHPAAMQDSFFSRGPADHAGEEASTAFGETTRVWHYVNGVDVSGGPGTVVALGDSITDGVTSTWGANRRWTDYLAARLASSPVPDYGIANSGISGNRVLLDSNAPNYTIYDTFGPSALTRLNWDVLERAGARTVIVFEGINDIQQTPHQADPEQIIAGLAQIAAQARARGLRVVGATIMAWKGWGSWTPELERTRVAVNEWIRAGGDGALDGLADFDAATRDPADPQRMLPAFDSGDHLHPNDAGDRAMAAVVPLARL